MVSFSMWWMRTHERPKPLGRKGERVAKTPIRRLPPKRGGRTVRLPLTEGLLAENCQMSHR